MIPRNYSEAQSELEKRRERKEKRLGKRDEITPNWLKILQSDKKLVRRAEKSRQEYLKSGGIPVMWAKKSRRKKKSSSRSKLEKEAWDAFSLYIRERDKGKGCISCGEEYEAMQAGHMISRRRRATKYDEINVNAQCARCNWKDKFMPGYHDRCVVMFNVRYGPDTYEKLVIRSTETVQHGKAEMIALRDTYREKLLTLKASREQQSEDDRMQR